MLNNNDFKYIFKKVIIFFLIFTIFSILKASRVNASTVLFPNAFNIYGQWNNSVLCSSTDQSGILYCQGPYNNQINRVIVAARSNGWSVANANLAVVNFSLKMPSNFNLDLKSVTLSANQDVNCYYTMNERTDGAGITYNVSAYCPYEYSTFTKNKDGWFFYIVFNPMENFYWFNLESLTYINDDLGITNILNGINNSNNDINGKLDNTNSYLITSRDNIADINRKLDIVQNKFNDVVQAQSQTTSAVQSNTQAVQDQAQQTRDTMTDSNTSDSENQLSGVVNNSAFNDSSGLSSIITLPVSFIQGIGGQCHPLSLHVPYFDIDLTVPCMGSYLDSKLPSITTILRVVINGFILYRVLLDIFFIVKSSRNPDDDRIEVLDL